MESIRAVMRDAQRDANRQIVSKEFIDKYIDRIFATPQEDGSLRLEIKIFTGEATEKYLSRLKQRAAEQENTPEYAAVGALRTGHTFKMMMYPCQQKTSRNQAGCLGHIFFTSTRLVCWAFPLA